DEPATGVARVPLHLLRAAQLRTVVQRSQRACGAVGGPFELPAGAEPALGPQQRALRGRQVVEHPAVRRGGGDAVHRPTSPVLLTSVSSASSTAVISRAEAS